MTDLLRFNELYAALTSNAALMKKVTTIADIIPDKQKSPYIELGTLDEVHDLILKGSAVTLRLHIWSTYRGRKEILEIRELVKAALPKWVMNTDIEILQDSEEPNWWHGIMTVKYLA